MLGNKSQDKTILLLDWADMAADASSLTKLQEIQEVMNSVRLINREAVNVSIREKMPIIFSINLLLIDRHTAMILCGLLSY